MSSCNQTSDQDPDPIERFLIEVRETGDVTLRPAAEHLLIFLRTKYRRTSSTASEFPSTPDEKKRPEPSKGTINVQVAKGELVRDLRVFASRGRDAWPDVLQWVGAFKSAFPEYQKKLSPSHGGNFMRATDGSWGAYIASDGFFYCIQLDPPKE